MPSRRLQPAENGALTRRSSVILAVLVGLLYAGIYFPVFRRLVGRWYDDPNYSHGFLVPLVSAYLVWDQRDRLRNLPTQPSAWGAAALIGGLLLLVLGTLGAELFLQNVSTVIVLAALVWLLLGTAWLRNLAFPLGFLLFFVPLPAIVLNQIAFPLQLFASKCAVATLYVFGAPVLRQGNTIELAGTTLEVAEACSGIRSLQALVALSTLVAYLGQKALYKRVMLVILSIPIAVVANASRVSGTGLIAHYYGIEKAEGFYHGFAGWLVFVVALALLVASSWLLTRLPPHGSVRPEPPSPGDPPDIGAIP
jgi:exosortase A